MRIVNVRGLGPNDPAVVYCGRAVGPWHPSPLRNPFCLGQDGTRAEVIAMFRAWLWAHLSRRGDDPECGHEDWDACPVRLALSQLRKDSVLGCWCAPKPCHCEVIVRAWHWLQTQAQK